MARFLIVFRLLDDIQLVLTYFDDANNIEVYTIADPRGPRHVTPFPLSPYFWQSNDLFFTQVTIKSVLFSDARKMYLKHWNGHELCPHPGHPILDPPLYIEINTILFLTFKQNMKLVS